MTGYGTIDSAVEATLPGAHDYPTKPLRDDEAALHVERALQQQALRSENQAMQHQLEGRHGLQNIIGSDYRMARVFEFIETVADSRITQMLSGESGTGKSLAARAIHHHSPRAYRPFIEVSWSSTREPAAERVVRSRSRAFTGAHADKEGRFKAADGGTIFLDEIATASLPCRSSCYVSCRSGSSKSSAPPRPSGVDVRIVLATNLDLEDEVAAMVGSREDLYYCVNVADDFATP